MSDEQRKDEETEVEAHRHDLKRSEVRSTDEPQDENDVEAHRFEVKRPLAP